MKVMMILFLLMFTGCQKAIPLKAVKATLTRVESTVATTTTGTVDAVQQAVLSFGTVGRVEKTFTKAGSSVKKGHLLAKLENSDFQTVYDNADKDLNRARELFKDGLISKAGLDDAEKAFAIAKVNLDKSEIKAPFDGVVTDVNLQVGELSQVQASSDKPPIRMVDQKPRIIKGDIDEIDLSKVRIGSLARVRIPAVRNEPFMASIIRVVPYVNTSKEQERTARIEMTLSEESAAIPVGASAEIEVIVQSKDNVLAIPSRAVLGATGGASAKNSRYTYRFSESRIHRAPIETGIGNYDRTEIISGLSAGDIVVLPGDIELRDDMKAKLEISPWP